MNVTYSTHGHPVRFPFRLCTCSPCYLLPAHTWTSSLSDPESIPATLGLGIYTNPLQPKHHSRFLPKPSPPHVVSFCTVVAKLAFAPPVKSWFQYPCTSWMAMLDDGELMLDGLVGE